MGIDTKDGSKVAIKIFKLDTEEEFKKILNDISSLLLLSEHKHILKVIEADKGIYVKSYKERY